jgi:hypothetical protein
MSTIVAHGATMLDTVERSRPFLLDIWALMMKMG